MAVAAMALAFLAPRPGRVVRRLPLGLENGADWRLPARRASSSSRSARRSGCLAPPAIRAARRPTPPAPHSSAAVHRARERHDRAEVQAGRSTFLHDHTFGVVDPAIQVRALFHWSFTRFTSPQFAYARFTYEDPTVGRLLFTYLAALLPLIYYDRSCERPAHYLMSVLYLVLYVPGTLGLAFMWRGSGMDLTVVQLSLLISVMVLFGVAKMKTARLPVHRSGLPSAAFDVIVVSLTIVNIVALTYKIGANFHLVAFSDVYEQRFRNTRLVQSTALGYPVLVANYILFALPHRRGTRQEAMAPCSHCPARQYRHVQRIC